MSNTAFVITLVVSFVGSLYALNYISGRLSFKMNFFLTVLAILICTPLCKVVLELSQYALVMFFGFYLALGIYVVPRVKKIFGTSNEHNKGYADSGVSMVEGLRNAVEMMAIATLPSLEFEYKNIEKRIEDLMCERSNIRTGNGMFNFGKLSKSEIYHNQKMVDEIDIEIRNLEQKKDEMEKVIEELKKQM